MLTKVNILNGELTFGQYCELEQKLPLCQYEYEFVDLIVKVLSPESYPVKNYGDAEVLRYVKEAMDDFMTLNQQTKDRLHTTPSRIERLANVKLFNQQVGNLGICLSLAQQYGVDPDDVMKWQYGKVIGCLWYDKCKAEYQKRIDGVREKISRNKL